MGVEVGEGEEVEGVAVGIVEEGGVFEVVGCVFDPDVGFVAGAVEGFPVADPVCVVVGEPELVVGGALPVLLGIGAGEGGGGPIRSKVNYPALSGIVILNEIASPLFVLGRVSLIPPVLLLAVLVVIYLLCWLEEYGTTAAILEQHNKATQIKIKPILI